MHRFNVIAMAAVASLSVVSRLHCSRRTQRRAGSTNGTHAGRHVD